VSNGDRDRLVAAVRDVVPRLLAREIPLESRVAYLGVCVLASRIGQDTLSYFGILAKARSFSVIAGNAEWVRWMEDAPAPRPDGAWSVATTGARTAEAIDTHVVVDLGKGCST
jgi:hypothetical protein